MSTYDPKDWTVTATGVVKLTDAQVIEIIETRYQTTHREMAEKHNLSISGVRHIRAGRRRRDLWLEVQRMQNLL